MDNQTTAPAPTPAAPVAPSLQSLVQPVAAVPAAPADVAPAVPESAGGVSAVLQSRGFEIPEGLNEQQVMDTLVQQIDDANSIRDNFEPHREDFNSWRESQQAAESAPAVEASPPAVPGAATTPPPLSAGAAAQQLSEHAQILAKNGLVYQTEEGWKAKSPNFQSFADEHNQVHAHRQAIALSFMDDPTGFIQNQMKGLEAPDNSDVSALRQELDQVKQHLYAEYQAANESKVDTWIDKHSDHLFENGNREQFTPYAQKYNAIAGRLSRMAKNSGQSISRAQLHDQTLSMLDASGLSLDAVANPQQPIVAQAQQQQASQPTFMQQAAVTPQRATVNRLTEHPAQQPSGVHVPTGKNGRPSLAALINSQASNGSPN